MATFQSRQVADKMPIPSHGYGSSTKTAHFQIALGVTTAADIIELGFLPDYAVPVEVIVHSTAAISISVGTVAAPAGLMANAAVAANVPLRSALATELFKNVGLGQRAVRATVGTGGTAGVLNVCVMYVVEDTGVGYPFTAAT